MKQRDTARTVPRHDTIKSHLIAEHRHDPYKASHKPSEPCVCPQCKAVYLGGRWQWIAAPLEKTHWEQCPACHRIADRFPAGEMTLTGRFLTEHGEEIVRLSRNIEALERHEHPLQRIMDIDVTAEKIVMTTTDIHLPRRIGHALERAYKGELDTHYDEGGYFIRMTWHRDV